MGIVYFANFSRRRNRSWGTAHPHRAGPGQGFSAEQFKNEVCKYLVTRLSRAPVSSWTCAASSFAGAGSNLTEPMGSDGNQVQLRLQARLGGDVVVVKAFYPLDIGSVLPASISLSNMAGNSRLIVATAAFRNEPFK
ncbi:MAG: hypothetical protein R3D01_08530 [Hyphomicrobiales bacterium]